MRLLILRSQAREGFAPGTSDYLLSLDTRYAERVLGNLRGEERFCTACYPDCVSCRKPYQRQFGHRIAGVIDFPATLPYLLERPGDWLPPVLPPHEVMLAIHIHEQILLEILKQTRRWGTKAVVIPLEAPGWISPAARREAARICRENGVEVSFPKPFCTLDPLPGSWLARFRDEFHLGRPKVDLTVEGDRIEKALVRVSAPCGSTYYIARWLAGRRMSADLRYEVISRRLHSYPCTGSMEWDEEIGDTVLHLADRVHEEILIPFLGPPAPQEGMFLSPLGFMLPKPVPPQENWQNIEDAAHAILRSLRDKDWMSLAELRGLKDASPAAITSALIILRRDGRIRMKAGKVGKA